MGDNSVLSFSKGLGNFQFNGKETIFLWMLRYLDLFQVFFCFIAVSPDPAVDQDPTRTASIYLTEPKAIEVRLCVF